MDEVDVYVREQRSLAEQARREYEAAYPQDALRAKLLARLEQSKKASS